MDFVTPGSVLVLVVTMAIKDWYYSAKKDKQHIQDEKTTNKLQALEIEFIKQKLADHEEIIRGQICQSCRGVTYGRPPIRNTFKRRNKQS